MMNLAKPLLCFVCFLIFTPAQADIQSQFDQIKKDPNALYEFLKEMPKGGELHYHLAGGPYPETMLELATTKDHCLNTQTLTLEPISAPCKGINIKELTQHPELYEKTIKSWSMKDFIPGIESGHDHFFNSFPKFISLIGEYSPELVADVMQRAANQQEEYLELMILPDNGHSISFGSLLKDTSSFAQKRQILLANADFQKNIATSVNASEQILTQARQKLGCESKLQPKGCNVTIKFLAYSLREQPLDNVFAQTLNNFEAVARSQSQNGNLVGVNLVQPEDGIISLRDYRKQMQIYQYLHQVYPQVNIALHAGELAPGLVTPEELTYHVHDALFTGQAQRIGHGVDIAYEDKAKDSLEHMVKHQKAVEINLISNQKILNISGPQSPLNYYLAHHVPVVLSTDDEGILRTNLTAQYVEAVLAHGLDYPTLKQISRNALTYAFVSGKSIWANADKAQFVSDCQNLHSESCRLFIKNSEKAQLQWRLEQKLKDFESKY